MGRKAVEVLVDGDGLARQAVAPAALLDLPAALADRHGVVVADRALGLDREDPVEILSRAGPEGPPELGGRPGETAIELEI